MSAAEGTAWPGSTGDVDGAALAAFTAEYGRELPPVAIVIAAYN
jgi:hypothetical protein